jgi:hypothetical protein
MGPQKPSNKHINFIGEKHGTTSRGDVAVCAMSTTAFDWLDSHAEKLTDTEHRVVYKLCRGHSASDGDVVVLDANVLADHACLSQDQLSRLLFGLIDTGLIEASWSFNNGINGVFTLFGEMS